MCRKTICWCPVSPVHRNGTNGAIGIQCYFPRMNTASGRSCESGKRPCSIVRPRTTSAVFMTESAIGCISALDMAVYTCHRPATYMIILLVAMTVCACSHYSRCRPHSRRCTVTACTVVIGEHHRMTGVIRSNMACCALPGTRGHWDRAV